MANQISQGENNGTIKPPPEPSSLRKANFFQEKLRILVSGGAGFIGSHLVDKLMENEKNEVVVMDNYFTGSKDNLKQWIGHQTEDYWGNVNPIGIVMLARVYNMIVTEKILALLYHCLMRHVTKPKELNLGKDDRPIVKYVYSRKAKKAHEEKRNKMGERESWLAFRFVHFCAYA